MKYLMVAGCVMVVVCVTVPMGKADSSPDPGQPSATLILQCGSPAAVPSVEQDASLTPTTMAPAELQAGAPDIPIPEPSPILLLSIGLVGLYALRQWTRRVRGPAEHDEKGSGIQSVRAEPVKALSTTLRQAQGERGFL